MIESQTKLPAQEGGPATLWARGQRAFVSVVKRASAQARTLPGSQAAETIKRLGLFAGDVADKAELQARTAQFLRWVGSGIGDGSLLSRFALHLVVILLAFGVVAFSRATVPEIDFLLPTPTPAPALGEHTVVQADSPVTNRGVGRFVDNGTFGLFQAPVAHTTIAEWDRMELITYTVQANDNVWSIAQGFGLKATTVLWANPAVEQSPDLLRVGQVLVVPPVDGIYYTVQAGDTVEKLAKKYKASADEIITFELNGLEEPYTLTAGAKLMIPGGSKPVPVANYYPMTQVGSAPKDALKGSGRFAWPTRGLLSQRYWSGHQGIDIANRTGTPILAADAGYVVMAGRDTYGYGNQVVIDHGNGFKTRYAHLQTINVKAGDTVQKQQQIGTMGSTGRSTGPHLHFEIIQNGVRRNPQAYLK
jgi:murein DD-endopeptidase MepM/ murein hydrolase activator NlpD